ncbi:MAG: hypothetical protein GF344_02430 [Chitinivibrionales bacterium]|nr:hypothetical protein [Chitinivibrionales bacterium]
MIRWWWVWLSGDPAMEYWSGYCYVGCRPIIAIKRNGKITEVVIWDPVGHGKSSFPSLTIFMR